MNDLLGLQSFHTAFSLAIYLQEKQNTLQQPEWQQRGEKVKKLSQISAAEQELRSPQCRAPREQQNRGSSLSAELCLEVQLPCTCY